MSNSCQNDHYILKKTNVRIEQQSNAHIKCSGDNSMVPGYTPKKDMDVVTKKYLSECVSVLIAQDHTVHKGSYPMPLKFSSTEAIFYNFPMLEEGMIWKEGDFFLSVDELNLFKLVKSTDLQIYDLPPLKFLNGKTYIPCDYRKEDSTVYEVEILAKKEYIFFSEDPNFPWDDVDWDAPEVQIEAIFTSGFFVENQLSCHTKKKKIPSTDSSIHYKILKVITGENTYTLKVSHFLDPLRLLWTQVQQNSLTLSISDLYAKHTEIDKELAVIQQNVFSAETSITNIIESVQKNTKAIDSIPLFFDNLFYKCLVPIQASDVVDDYVSSGLILKCSGLKLTVDHTGVNNGNNVIQLKNANLELVMRVSYVKGILSKDEKWTPFTTYTANWAFQPSAVGCFLKSIEFIHQWTRELYIAEYSYLKMNPKAVGFNFRVDTHYPSGYYEIEFFRPGFSLNINLPNV